MGTVRRGFWRSERFADRPDVVRSVVPVPDFVLPKPVLEVAFGWRHPGRSLPYPMQIPQFGRTTAERALVKRQVADWVTEQGLGDGERLRPGLGAVLDGLACFDVMLTCLFAGPEGQLQVGCVGHEGRGWRLSTTSEDAVPVEVARIDVSHLVAAMLEALPPARPAQTQPLSVPAEPLEEAGARWQRTGLLDSGVAHLVDAGAERRQAEHFLRTFASITAIGQISAARLGPRQGCPALAEQPVTIFDTPAGRMMSRVRNGRATMAPAERRELHSALAALLAGAFS